MSKKQNLIALYKEGVEQLKVDFNNVKTDHGRTIISDAIKEYEEQLNQLTYECN